MTYTLITGASGGLGLAFAKQFAQKGHNLILVARNRSKLEEIKTQMESQYAVSVVVIDMDLSETDASLRLHKETNDRELKIDNLVNNAGFGDHRAFLDSDWNRQYEMVQLNITALMQLMYLYGNDMKARSEGHILNLSSVAAFSAGPYMSIYYATKGYVLSFSQAVAQELSGTGVTVTALCPGPTATGFEKAANMSESKMFTFFHPASADAVAEYGYRAMQQGKTIACHSAATHIMNIGSRLVPRRVAGAFAMHINGSK